MTTTSDNIEWWPGRASIARCWDIIVDSFVAMKETFIGHRIGRLFKTGGVLIDVIKVRGGSSGGCSIDRHNKRRGTMDIVWQINFKDVINVGDSISRRCLVDRYDRRDVRDV
jgi:hypothetical protein